MKILKLIFASFLVLSNFANAKSTAKIQQQTQIPQTPKTSPDMPIHALGENKSQGKAGQIFGYFDSKTNQDAYFKLLLTGAYTGFPAGTTSNKYWQYLGAVAPDNRLHRFNENTKYGKQFGAIGNVYVVFDPVSQQTQYFKLQGLDSLGRFGALPKDVTNNPVKDNFFWKYLGINKPENIYELACSPDIKINFFNGNTHKGTVGDIYNFYNPKTHEVEYFKLDSVKGSSYGIGTYGNLPMNRRDNEWWSYLGLIRPDNRLHRFNEDTEKGKQFGAIGNIYVEIEPTTQQPVYFRLQIRLKKLLDKTGRFGALPTIAGKITSKAAYAIDDNSFWKYLGDRLPADVCTIDSDVTPPDPEPNPDNLPPDPGAAGKATLEGIDSNGNGVRDDLEIAIYKRYPDPKDIGKINAQMQEAKVLQDAIIAGANDDRDAAYAVEQDRSAECIWTQFGGYKNTPKEDYYFIEEIIVDTNERLRAYLHYNQLLSGGVFSGYEGNNPCDN